MSASQAVEQLFSGSTGNGNSNSGLNNAASAYNAAFYNLPQNAYATAMPTETLSIAISPLAAAAAAAAASAIATADKSRQAAQAAVQAAASNAAQAGTWLTFPAGTPAAQAQAAVGTTRAATAVIPIATTAAGSNSGATASAATGQTHHHLGHPLGAVATLPAATTAPTYHFHAARPAGPTFAALGSVPIYAFARPPLQAQPLAAPSFITPYYTATYPTALFAYRPLFQPHQAATGPAGSFLTAASFAYPTTTSAATAAATPLRLPIGANLATLTATTHTLNGNSNGKATANSLQSNRVTGNPFSSLRPHNYYSDLQFAETKPKSTSSNNANSDSTAATTTSSTTSSKIPFGRAHSSLSAIAKNLTKKMFGSASQLKPQILAPPSITIQSSLGGTTSGSSTAPTATSTANHNHSSSGTQITIKAPSSLETLLGAHQALAGHASNLHHQLQNLVPPALKISS